jgi:phospholipid transport system substrate-binding protein
MTPPSIPPSARPTMPQPLVPPRLAALVLLLLVGLAQGSMAGLAQEDNVPAAPPAAVVERVDETLIGAMQEAETLGFQGRYDRLAPVFMPAFHFPFMARVAAGRYWKDLDPEQQKQLAEAFGRMSVTNFAARFDGYDGQRFEVGESIEQPRGGVLVRNRLIDGTGKGVSIDYLLRDFDGRWRIIDVFLEGAISEIATKRSEYTAILGEDGIDGLLAKISDKTAELAGN